MSDHQLFEASVESKSKAKQYRIVAFVAWIIAIGAELFAIMNLINSDRLIWLIVTIVIMLILSVTGNVLWQKANGLDPASEHDEFQFFVQNQLGAIMAVLAFLPLVVFIFMSKDADKKTKSIAGVVAIIAMLIAGVSGIDFNPPSVEKYTQEINEQTDVLKKLNFDKDNVYWTAAGNKYHVFEDCQHIKGRDEINNGTVKESWEKKGISELCKTCQKRAIRERTVAE